MEDIRKLLNDVEAEIAPESLAYTVRGLTMALADELRDGPASEAADRRRHLEIVAALGRSLDLYSAMLARWMGQHADACLAER